MGTDSMEASAQAGNTYILSLDYSRRVEDVVEAGCYNWSNPDITSKNFRTKRRGVAVVVAELIHFNRYVSTDEALHELDRMGYRPAELHELLAFGEKYPEVQREFPIVALGSVRRRRRGRDVPYLNRYCSRCDLNLRQFGFGWDGIWRFAAVRK